eukprot:sb/3478566/
MHKLSLPQINLFKVVLKSLKLLMESRTYLPSPSTLRVPCRWALPIWNNTRTGGWEACPRIHQQFQTFQHYFKQINLRVLLSNSTSQANALTSDLGGRVV